MTTAMTVTQSGLLRTAAEAALSETTARALRPPLTGGAA